jgi:hypothetical protein
MIEMQRRALRRLKNVIESSFVAVGTARSRHYAPLTHPSRRG